VPTGELTSGQVGEWTSGQRKKFNFFLIFPTILGSLFEQSSFNGLDNSKISLNNG
jgi:hypothetical protein